MTNKPTDAEIIALADETRTGEPGRGGYILPISFARAVLAKWGQPAHSGEPVAWLSPWRADQVTTDYDAYGARGTPLYTAPQPVEREPLSDEEVDSLCKVGFVYVIDGKVTRTPTQYRDELKAAQRYGLRKGERAHGIKGGQHGTE